jgi:glycosyltransferase involved in cell wall biosynthesis
VLAGRKVHHDNSKLRALHEKWNLEGRVTYLGMIEKPEDLVASLDIGVIASRGSEGFSRIAVEYMASRVPFVATRVGALPQIVRDGESGLLVPPENVDAMTAAIGRLVADPQLRARLAGNALAEVRERFDPSRYGEEMEEVYYSALAARHG